MSEDVVKLKGLLFSSDAQVLSVMNQVLDNLKLRPKFASNSVRRWTR